MRNGTVDNQAEFGHKQSVAAVLQIPFRAVGRLMLQSPHTSSLQVAPDFRADALLVSVLSFVQGLH